MLGNAFSESERDSLVVAPAVERSFDSGLRCGFEWKPGEYLHEQRELKMMKLKAVRGWTICYSLKNDKSTSGFMQNTQMRQQVTIIIKIPRMKATMPKNVKRSIEIFSVAQRFFKNYCAAEFNLELKRIMKLIFQLALSSPYRNEPVIRELPLLLCNSILI